MSLIKSFLASHLGCPRSKMTDIQVDGMNLYTFSLSRSNRADQTFGLEHILIFNISKRKSRFFRRIDFFNQQLFLPMAYIPLNLSL